MLKRRGAIQTYDSRALKRLKRVENQVRRNKPETKYKQFALTQSTFADGTIELVELTNFAQGDDVSEREGNHVTIRRVEVRGYLGFGFLHGYIVQGHTTTLPTYATFQNVDGGSIVPIENNTRFTEWLYFNSQKLYDKASIVQTFKYGLKAKYNGSLGTSCVDNRLWLVVKNDTGSAESVRLSVRVWYTDA